MSLSIPRDLAVGLAACILLLMAAAASPANANYEISGVVGTPSYERLSGVVVTLTGSAAMQDTTGEDGKYSFTGLAAGDYVVAPALENWAFDPPSRVYTGLSADQLDQHYFGTQVGFRISGLVYTNFGSPVAGAVIALTGDAGMQDTTDIEGRYSFNGRPAGNYEVTPELPGWKFEPESRAYEPLDSDRSSQNFTGLPKQGSARVVGGENGYIDAAKGEKATVYLSPYVTGTVRFTVYTLRGEKVYEAGQFVEPGVENSFEWDCANHSGELVAPGVYVIEMDGAGIAETARIAVIR
jgi:hypothetical protein